MDITQTYDGTGAPAKRVQISRQPDFLNAEGPPIEDTQTTFYVRSGVLGAAVVELNGPGSSDIVNIYAGGQRIARDEWNNITFEHTNPITGSRITSAGHSSHRATNRQERDSFGAEIPNSNPYPSLQTYVDYRFGEQLYIEGGDPFDYSTGREIDGIPVSETEFQRRVGNGSVDADVFLAGRYAGSIDLRSHSSFGVPWNIRIRLSFWGTVESDNDLNTPMAPDLENSKNQIETATTSTGQRWLGAMIVNVMFGGTNSTQSQTQTPINVTGIRNGLIKSLSNPDCAKFVDSLLTAVATKKNPLLTEYTNARSIKDGILAMFDAVIAQNGLTRNRPPRSAGYANPIGRIPNNDAAIFIVGGAPNSAIQLEGDIKNVLHELIHMAGRKRDYADRAFAEIVRRDYPGLSTSIWPGDKGYAFYKDAMKDPNHIGWGYYWNYGLSKKCF